MKIFLKKQEYRLFIESTAMEKATFPYKSALSEANVKKIQCISRRFYPAGIYLLKVYIRNTRTRYLYC